MDSPKQNQEIGASPVTKRFIMCRTEPEGWQERGFVIMAASLTDASAGLKKPATIWVEDDPATCQPGDVYPLPAANGTAAH